MKTKILGLLAMGLLAGAMFPAPATATPVAGDYQFTSGLVGTFTSTGAGMSAWLIPVGNSTFDSANLFQLEAANSADEFFTQQFLGNDFLRIDWPNNTFHYQFPGPCSPFTGCEFINGAITFESTTAPTVPEPGTLALLGLGLAGLGLSRRRKAA